MKTKAHSKNQQQFEVFNRDSRIAFPLKKFENPEGSFLGFQIYYDALSKDRLDPGLNSYFNENATKFLESQVIVDIVESGAHREADFFGVFSWKMHQKLALGPTEMFDFMAADGFQNDVYLFNFVTTGKSVWHNGENFTALGKVAQLLLNRLGYSVELSELETPPIFQNHYICRSSVYEAFCNEMLKPAIALVESGQDPELNALLDFDTAYPFEDRMKGQIEKVFGRSCYTRHPFVGERLFATWYGLKAPERKYKKVVYPTAPIPTGYH